jgi:hypothetical protein
MGKLSLTEAYRGTGTEETGFDSKSLAARQFLQSFYPVLLPRGLPWFAGCALNAGNQLGKRFAKAD